MKVVIDTNVFLSSFFGGNPKKIIDLWKARAITICLSKPILDEYLEVLRRMGFEEDPEWEDLLSLFAQGFQSLYTTRTPKLKVVQKDPDDDKFIECAVALKAASIVTGDKALLELQEYIGIQILNPNNFLKQFFK